MINKHQIICTGFHWNDFAVPGCHWSRISNNVYCMPEGQNETWGKKEVIFNCSPSPASPYDLLVWCHDSLQPYTRPFTFLFEEDTRAYTRNFHTWRSNGFHTILMSASFCSMKQVINAFTSQQHLTTAMPTSLSISTCIALSTHNKNTGKQLVPTTVKSTVEVHSVSHTISIGTVWERAANTDSCILLHSTTASITVIEWQTYTAVHTIILLWISENVMCEPTNRESLL